jgi:oxygen-independent coproporphyrinogen-3 oxidase
VQELDAAESLAEIPMLGLRLHRGVDWMAVRQMAEANNLMPLMDAWEAQLAPFERGGLVIREGPIMRLSERGILLSNGILSTFV